MALRSRKKKAGDDATIATPEIQDAIAEAVARVDVEPLTELTGTHCSDCGKPQYATPSGNVCVNGHGGAPALEDTRASSVLAEVVPSESKNNARVFTKAEREEIAQLGLPRARATGFGGKSRNANMPGVELDPAVAERIMERARSRRPAPTRARETDMLACDFKVDATGQVIDLRPTRDGGAVSFVSRPTRDLLEILDPEAVLAGPRIDGAIVKVTCAVKASERDAFDGVGIKARLLAHGAATVVLAPRIVSDSGVTRKARIAAAHAAAVSPEQAVREYFAGVHGLAPDEVEEAIATALEIVQGA